MDVSNTATNAFTARPAYHSQSHRPFRRAAVLGAGTMGSQIAAHLANAGLDVLLLDVPGDGQDRNAVVRRGLERLTGMSPRPLFDESRLQRIQIGNLEDDVSRLTDAEWIVEAVVEQPDVKRRVLEHAYAHASGDAVISTNTSGIQVGELIGRLDSEFARRFLGTHFFNPPRYLKLVEVIPTPQTDVDVVERVERFARVHLGKGVVRANDRPYFIGNRVGVYALVRAMRRYFDGAYSLEEIDALTGPLVGRPRSATFRTADIVGLDVIVHVLDGMRSTFQGTDDASAFDVPPLLRKMVEEGAIGAKVGAGFYRKTAEGLERIERDGSGYALVQENSLDVGEVGSISDLGERLVALYDQEGRAGQFFRASTLELMSYASRCVPEVTENPADLDRALKWGFGWEMGPFETWQTLGTQRVLADMRATGLKSAAWVDAVSEEGRGEFFRRRGDALSVYFPERNGYEEEAVPADTISLAMIRGDARAVLWENDAAALVDVGDNVALFEFRTKGSTLSRTLMAGLREALESVENHPDLRGVVIGHDGKNFSVGANLVELAAAAESGDFNAIDGYLAEFQDTILRVRYCSKPVVVATHQRVLGGGCEMAMACPHPVASAESYVGLVELGVGLIPAGTGSMHLAALAAERSPTRHHSHIQPFLQRYFEQVARADVSTSAVEAIRMGYLAESTEVVMHDERHLFVARDRVIHLSNTGYRPPSRRWQIRVLGQQTHAALVVGLEQYRHGGFISAYDAFLAQQLGYVMTGGDLSSPQDVDESYLLDLEREVFLRLAGEERTRQRVVHMLKHKKPLRN